MFKLIGANCSDFTHALQCGLALREEVLGGSVLC